MGRMFSKRGSSSREAISEKKEFDQRVIDIARVTRVMAGGKRMRFRACVAIGDRRGRVGVAVGKGADVAGAISKAVNKAKKEMISVSLFHSTIPHRVRVKFGASEILFKPAPIGTGIRAGGSVRAVLDLAGVPNVVAKILRGSNKINTVQATIQALTMLRKVKEKNEAEKTEKPQEEKQ